MEGKLSLRTACFHLPGHVLWIQAGRIYFNGCWMGLQLIKSWNKLTVFMSDKLKSELLSEWYLWLNVLMGEWIGEWKGCATSEISHWTWKSHLRGSVAMNSNLGAPLFVRCQSVSFMKMQICAHYFLLRFCRRISLCWLNWHSILCTKT